MSGIGSSPPLAPLTPVWSIDHPETLLWRGAGCLTGQRADRETELVATWRPELDVRFHQEPDDAEDLELFDTADAPSPSTRRSQSSRGAAPTHALESTQTSQLTRS